MAIFERRWIGNLFIVFIISLLSLSVPATVSDAIQSESHPSAFRLKTIVIDPGHGGRDPGHVSRRKVKEKDVNLSIALKLAQLLRNQTKYKVVLTRTTDRSVSLIERANIANRFPANETLFISIHCNSHSNSSVHGLESYIFNLKATDLFAAKLAKRENAEEQLNPVHFIINNLQQRGRERYSWEAARVIQSVLADQLKSKNRNRNAPDKLVRRAPFVVLAKTNTPATLVELGYLSNSKESGKLTSTAYQQQVANALLEAVGQFNQVTQELAKNGIHSPQPDESLE
jgi:N-acetylmuramoyl-L-alanine amidase